MAVFHKNILGATLLVLILFLIVPKTTSASVPTFEMNPLLTGGVKATAVSTYAQLGQTIWKFALDAAVETLKRQILNMMVDQIVNWIQGGGEPKFITDWPAFFREAVDQAGGKFLQQMGLSQLCSPFKALLSAGLILKPQNNVYGAYIMAWDQYEIEKSAAEKSAAAEAQAGRGFLGVKECLEWDSSQAISACSEVYTDCKAQGSSSEECAQIEKQCYDQNQICKKYQTKTPGSVVGDLAAKAVGSDIDWLVNADDLAAYTSAIANAILNRMFAEGLSGLKTALTSNNRGESGGRGSGGGSAAQAQCAQLLGTAAYNDCVSSIQAGMDMREFQKNTLITMIDDELSYQNQLLGAKQATLTILNQSADILKQLGDCQGSISINLAPTQSSASTTMSQIAQIQSDIIALQMKQQEIKSITDIRQIPALWSQVSGVVKPAVTQSLALSAQQETTQKQQKMDAYQGQLDACKSEQNNP
ncbi:MAG: hypothetical protein UV39_C0010G0008 [Candidatus Azambacteria bacterium GW2011_GWA2_42_62]|nr:MAG: hypothetical protein UV39_C0010G0008 [Candidatus Azambacteria bacterium GW2011_GWA2_42_62]